MIGNILVNTKLNSPTDCSGYVGNRNLVYYFENGDWAEVIGPGRWEVYAALREDKIGNYNNNIHQNEGRHFQRIFIDHADYHK